MPADEDAELRDALEALKDEHKAGDDHRAEIAL